MAATIPEIPERSNEIPNTKEKITRRDLGKIATNIPKTIKIIHRRSIIRRFFFIGIMRKKLKNCLFFLCSKVFEDNCKLGKDFFLHIF